MLVSVHMPKTAGMSFRSSLEEHFGEGFRPDYEDYPLAKSPEQRRALARQWAHSAQSGDYSGVGCIHGHFLPLKYLSLADAVPCTFVTWLREPVARLVSHYYYWQRAYNPAADTTSVLHRRVIEEGWTLQRFCLAPELRNVYCEFLWDFPLERFDFIGITEFFAEDLRYFSHEILGNKMSVRTLNRRADADSAGLAAAMSAVQRAEIEAYHAADMALYRHALARRKQRCEA